MLVKESHVEVDRTPLIFCLRKHFSNSLQRTKAFISNDEFHAIQVAAALPMEEANPAGLRIKQRRMRYT